MKKIRILSTINMETLGKNLDKLKKKSNFSFEEQYNKNLKKNHNLIILPHIGGSTIESIYGARLHVIKKILPPRIFFPTKTSKVKDTLHISVKPGDKIMLNYNIKIRFEKWGLIIDNNIKKNKKFKFMGKKTLDHLIWAQKDKEFNEYCKVENQKILSIKDIAKIYKC